MKTLGLMGSIPWVLTAFGLLAVLNLAVSAVVWRSGLFDSKQLAAQLLLVWGAPLVGAVFVWLFAVSERDHHRASVDRDHSDWENVNAGHNHGNEP